MSTVVNLGGERLGSGAKMKQNLHGWERSTHDLHYIWRSTMAAGTIVPFMSEVALPEDTWDIDLNADCLTHPTVGPLFGSFKLQCDIFWAPIRLYQAKLHNNAAMLGMSMQDVKIPLLGMNALWDPTVKDLENSQVNPSSIFAYLGYRGLGATPTRAKGTVFRKMNAVPYFMYWDVYKNFYANKQEEIGYYIHNEPEALVQTVTGITRDNPAGNLPQYPSVNGLQIVRSTLFKIAFSGATPKPKQIIISTSLGDFPVDQIWADIQVSGSVINCQQCILNTSNLYAYNWRYISPSELVETEPKLVQFPLKAIDDLRVNILAQVGSLTAFEINNTYPAPFGPPMNVVDGFYSKLSSQEGLGIKTYQSDIFNNWLNTAWINSVNSKSTISTAGNQFTVEALIMAKKVFDHFNRVAASDGTYMSWLKVTYDGKPYMGCIAPEYMGGLSKELVFQEVISTSEAVGTSTEQPLGTLAGRGKMSAKHKGGKIRVKPDEIGYIQGMVSLTPRIDYSQGNTWDINLLTMDDFHKPVFDQIGFQDLITDKMYWPETTLNASGTPTFRAAGKTVAWLDYMTNYNKVFGNFAIAGNEMFMTLNRRYEPTTTGIIKDLSTYIDPVKFNQIFAYTKRDAQNFWMQIGVGLTVRRKMSAKQIPNL